MIRDPLSRLRRFVREGWTLRMSLVLSVVVPLALVAVAGTFLIVREVEEAAVERMQDDVELVARAIRLPLSRSLELGREGAVVTTLESAFRIGRVYGASLYDDQGELVATVGAGREDGESDRLEEIARGDDRMGEYSEAGGREVYSYFVPLTGSGGRSLGVLQVTRQRSDIDEHVAQIRAKAFSLLTLGLLAIAGLVLVGHRGAVGRYLDRLLTSMARVEGGARDHRAGEEGPRELARLATGLNTMLDSISRAEAEVESRRSTQRQLEAELREAEKLAAVGRLSAGVAHELGNPLSVLDGKAQRLLRREELEPDAVRDIRGLRREVRRMEGIVRQLLEFGRSEGGARRPVPAEQLARSAVASVADEARLRQVELEVEGPRGRTHVLVDPPRFEGALVNLLRNAVHAADGGRVVVRWGTEHSARDPSGPPAEELPRAFFQVLDDGPGLSEEVRSRLFEPFFTTKPIGEGTGLGLAVVHGVVEEHGGSIVAENREDGPGASFTIHVPTAESRAAVPGEEVEARSTPSTAR